MIHKLKVFKCKTTHFESGNYFAFIFDYDVYAYLYKIKLQNIATQKWIY